MVYFFSRSPASEFGWNFHVRPEKEEHVNNKNTKNHVHFTNDVQARAKKELAASKKQIKNNQVEWQGTLTKINIAILMLEHWLIRFYFLFSLAWLAFVVCECVWLLVYCSKNIWTTFRNSRLNCAVYSHWMFTKIHHSDNLWTKHIHKHTQTERKMFFSFIYLFFAFLHVSLVISSRFRHYKPEPSVYPWFVVALHFTRCLNFHSTL